MTSDLLNLDRIPERNSNIVVYLIDQHPLDLAIEEHQFRWLESDDGNIRELSNLVERLAIIKPEGVIGVEDLPSKYREAGPAPATNNVSQAMQLTSANLKDSLQSLEQDLIAQAMQAADGVVAQAARLLNMRRTTLVEKLAKYRIPD